MEYQVAYQPTLRVVIDCGADGKTSRTKQAHKNECDINNIMAKYLKTGILEHAENYSGQYGFATQTDFKESLQLIAEAQNMFDALPAKARKKFNNDPGEFLEFVQNPANESELYDLGLSTVPIIEEAQPAETPPAETLSAE